MTTNLSDIIPLFSCLRNIVSDYLSEYCIGCDKFYTNVDRKDIKLRDFYGTVCPLQYFLIMKVLDRLNCCRECITSNNICIGSGMNTVILSSTTITICESVKINPDAILINTNYVRYIIQKTV